MQKCEGCPLGDRPKVLGQGCTTDGNKLFVCDDEQFDVVVVGEAPASEELARGMPMVGPSGKFSRSKLQQLGILKYWMTNIFKCPLSSEDKHLVDEALEHCGEATLQEVLSKKPKLVIAFGNIPLHFLSDVDYGIKEIEGRVFPSKVGALLPIAHPAFYLRRPDQAFDFIESLRAGVSYLSGNYRQASNVDLTLVTEDNMQEVLEILQESEYIAMDSETSGFFAYGTKPDYMLEMGLSISSSHSYIVPRDLVPHFKDLLETKKGLYWAARFDASFLKPHGITANVYFDGMLAHYCLDERATSHGLKKVARVYLGSEDWEKDINQYLPNKKNSSYELIPEDVRHVYLSKDSARTYQLWEVLEEEMKDNWVFWNIMMPGTSMFIDIEERGIKINPDKIVEMYNYLLGELDRLGEELHQMAGRSFNPSSPLQTSEIIYDEMGIPVNPKYGRSTNKHLLEEYREDYPFIDKLIEYREAVHDIGNYVKGFVSRMDNDFRVHPAIKMFGTVTGRLASENPAVHNIKSSSRVKELFLPEPGQLIAEFDFSGVEIRWYYMYTEDAMVKHILEEGFDEDFGFNLTEKERKDPHFVIGLVAYKDFQKATDRRVVTKSMVFGRMYGRGRKSFIEGGQRSRRGVTETGMILSEVDFLLSVIDNMLPDLKSYARARANEAKNQGYVESYFGRKRRFPLITSENRGEVERQARNMPIQSAASDLNLLCMLHLWDKREEYNIYPMFSVHDSIIVSIPDESLLPVLKKEIEDKAFELVEGKIQFPVDAKCGPSWGETK